MSFTSFSNAQTLTASDMNDNFLFIADGNRLPYTQGAAGTLTAVDDTYDLGGSTTAWHTVYCDNLNISGTISTTNKSMWSKIASTTLSATAALITFSGLDGDLYKQFRIMFRGIWVAGSVDKMTFNADSTGNYTSNIFWASTTSFQDSVNQSLTAARFWGLNSFLANILIDTATGKGRRYIYDATSVAAGAVTNISFGGGVWYDAVNNITSIEFSNGSTGYAAGTEVKIWGRV